jgi:hypothetical protein
VKALCDLLGIRTRMVVSSTLSVPGKATQRLVNFCKALGANTYLSGAGGKDYLELELFEKEGVKVSFQEYKHPAYPQLHGEFVPYLSVLDLLFNCGPKSREVLLT